MIENMVILLFVCFLFFQVGLGWRPISSIYVNRRLTKNFNSADSEFPKDDDLTKVLREAQKEDYDWLVSVLGESEVNHLTLKSSKKPNRQQTDYKALDGNNDLELFLSLGYSKNEIDTIRPEFRSVILSRSVRRPRRGIPDEWLVKEFKSVSSPEKAGTNRISNTRIEREQESGSPPREDFSEENISKFKPKKQPSSDIDKSSLTDDKAISWEGQPVTAEERRQSQWTEEEADEEDDRDGRDFDGMNDPFSFWPGTDEFKDLLLEESKWRVNLIGGWVSPFVRSETKWRYQVYKKWLELLDNGLFSDESGKAKYEIRFDDFDDPKMARAGGPLGRRYETAPREGGNNSNEGDPKSDQEWSGNPWESSEKPRGKSRPRTMEDFIPTENRGTYKKNIYSEAKASAVSGVKQKSNNKSTSKKTNVSKNKIDDKEFLSSLEEEVVDQDVLAREYDEWLKEKFLTASWTDTFEEEKRIRKLQEIEELNRQRDMPLSSDPNDKESWFSDDEDDNDDENDNRKDVKRPSDERVRRDTNSGRSSLINQRTENKSESSNSKVTDKKKAKSNTSRNEGQVDNSTDKKKPRPLFDEDTDEF